MFKKKEETIFQLENIKTPHTGNFHNIWHHNKSHWDECALECSSTSSFLSFLKIPQFSGLLLEACWPVLLVKWFPEKRFMLNSCTNQGDPRHHPVNSCPRKSQNIICRRSLWISHSLGQHRINSETLDWKSKQEQQHLSPCLVSVSKFRAIFKDTRLLSYTFVSSSLLTTFTFNASSSPAAPSIHLWFNLNHDSVTWE